ncbi:MAG: hypothetical protein ACYSUU_07850 [Planctomycetota bacterium]|jgi:hypothetical protein
MLDSILAVVLPMHIVVGAAAALVAFPIAVFASKGSRPHVAAGRCFVGGYVVVCLTGLLLEMERTTGGTIRVLWTDFKLVGPKVSDSGHLPPLLFFATATLDLAFLYLAVSGWRVWVRARDAGCGVFRRFDTILAVSAMLVAIAFGVSWWMVVDAVSTMPSAPKSNVVPHLFFTGAALVFLVDAGLDLRVRLTRRPPRAWWFKHARKMVMAQIFLAAGIPFRCADLEHVGFWTTATAFMVLLTGAIAALHFRHRLRIEAARTT